MPPSGFNQQAINGLLSYVKIQYHDVLSKYPNLNETEALQQAITELESNVSVNGIGLQAFMRENFKALIEEINIGKKELGNAMQEEIDNIGSYLERFKL